MDSRARYIKRIDDLKTKVALRMSVADVIGDLPQEIRALASDIIKFIDIHPQVSAHYPDHFALHVCSPHDVAQSPV